MKLQTFLIFLCAVVLNSTGALAETKTATAVFAGGCFWCMEPPYDALADKGVISVVSGYTGGHTPNPTYEQTSTGKTGHIEAIEITYDPKKITYTELLNVFWKNIDPYDKAGQFCDKGEQYTSAVFYGDEAEKKAYEDSLKGLTKFGIQVEKVATKLLPKAKFHVAEDYHQDYYKKNPIRYKYYRSSCGRDKRLKEVWK